MNDFIRYCPQCNEQLTYSTKGNLDTAELKGSSCAPCAQKEIDRWNAGKNKESDPKLAALSETLKRSMNEPELRARLDSKKRTPKEEIIRKIDESRSTWKLAGSLDGYTRKDVRNILFRCKVCLQEELKSLDDVTGRSRCKNCNPTKGKGDRNPAFVPLEKFLLQLAEKHGLEKFKFDPSTYEGKYTKMDWECSACSHRFSKAPRVLLQEAGGCPMCSKKKRALTLSRTREEFYEIAKKIHGDKFSYFPIENQEWKNNAQIKWKCNDCQSEHSQSVDHHLGGTSCPVCSEKFKHDSRTFILKSIKIWGPDAYDYSQVYYQGNKVHVDLKCKKCDHSFSVTPANHWTRGCPKCAKNRFVSIGETEWLNSLGVPPAQRQYFVTLPGGEVYNCDAVVGMTVYEYYGDYWHGNLKRFLPENINVYTGTTMLELNQATKDREDLLRAAGYTIVSMWESNWNEIRKSSIRPESNNESVSDERHVSRNGSLEA